MTRRPVDAGAVRAFMETLGRRASSAATVYLVGGATAVLMGWRTTTIDVDLRVEPDADPLLRLTVALKAELAISIELAAPDDFIPELPGWRDRSPFIVQHGPVVFRHYDPYAQVLAKIERWHDRDRVDVAAMLDTGLVDPARLSDLFGQIEPQLYRYPAIEPAAFRGRLEAVVADRPGHPRAADM